jgi:hypothetical protein
MSGLLSALDKRRAKKANILLAMARETKTQRGFIDYSLDKRATLLALFRGVVDACDADPYLMRAAKFHGEKAGRNCPVCKKDALVELRYTFGDQLGQYSGRIKSPVELIEMEKEFGEFSVYIVEVCRECSWNHLCSTYILGDGSIRKPPRRQRTLEDEDFSGNLGK